MTTDMHNIALANQARAIRLAAQRLEKLAAGHTLNVDEGSRDLRAVRKALSDIGHNHTALLARFGLGGFAGTSMFEDGKEVVE